MFAGNEVDKLVNLERAIKYNDMINGHLVTGHVDSVVSLEKRKLSQFPITTFLTKLINDF